MNVPPPPLRTGAAGGGVATTAGNLHLVLQQMTISLYADLSLTRNRRTNKIYTTREWAGNQRIATEQAVPMRARRIITFIKVIRWLWSTGANPPGSTGEAPVHNQPALTRIWPLCCELDFIADNNHILLTECKRPLLEFIFDFFRRASMMGYLSARVPNSDGFYFF